VTAIGIVIVTGAETATVTVTMIATEAIAQDMGTAAATGTIADIAIEMTTAGTTAMADMTADGMDGAGATGMAASGFSKRPALALF